MSDPNTTDLPDLFLVPEFHSTPWVRKPTVDSGRTLFVARILSAEGNTVADVKSVDNGVATAKAACIVAAVNQHAALLAEVATLKAQREALLKACKAADDAIGRLGHSFDDGTRGGTVLTQLCAAIAAAEGEEKP